MFCFILFSLLLSGFVSAAEVNPCASGWHFYNATGCCYKTTMEIGTWFQGTGMCAKMQQGSQLASLGSEAESKFVVGKYKNGIDGIHAWTGLSQTQTANNWTFTDGSKPWSSFFGPLYLLHNHTSCVEIVDNWLVELFQNSGKTQPTFCYHLLQSLCKYCPVPAVGNTTALPKVEKAHPRSNAVPSATVNSTSTIKSTTTRPRLTSVSKNTAGTVRPIPSSTTARPVTLPTQKVQFQATVTAPSHICILGNAEERAKFQAKKDIAAG